MFVSSFSTYVTNNTSNSATKTALNTKETKSSSFSSKLSENLNSLSLKTSVFTNYISNPKVLHNKQIIQQSQTDAQLNKKSDFKIATNAKNNYTSHLSLQSAKVAYVSNSMMFPLLKKPMPTINQTPKVNISLPKDLQEMQEQSMRHTMVNTYLANDNYYRVTA